MRILRDGSLFAGTLTVATLLAACGDPGASSSSPRTSGASTPVHVVASTDVWGDVVEQVAGDLLGSTVEVTSIITDPAADPHSYEADTQNLLAVSKAELVVENGGGYDDFVDSMLASAGGSPTVLDAVDISGFTAPSGGELNEHVWYDLPTVTKVADHIAAALADADPSDASTFRANAAVFEQEVSALEQTEDAVKAAHAGTGAAITEPVPLYLLTACGLVDKTPPDFSEAVEEGTDVSATVLKETEDLFNDKTVALLAYNEQTSGPETRAVLEAAKDNGIAVVPVTETLPSGQDYISWMRSNLAAIRSALG
jgi:zinc/manganese transport system substrate-binding protein